MNECDTAGPALAHKRHCYQATTFLRNKNFFREGDVGAVTPSIAICLCTKLLRVPVGRMFRGIKGLMAYNYAFRSD